MNNPMVTRSVYSRQVWWFASALVASSLWIVSPAGAKTPQEIFAEASPSIVVVEVSDAGGKLEATGSGVVIAKGEVITNCHVAEEGKTLRIKLGKDRYPATIHYADRDRDLCQLSAPKLAAPSATFGDAKSLSTGARVVAIGAPEGLELSISEGLISALRDYGDGSKIIQTTAAISPGSSGGGLFDENGKLIGFTTFTLKEGQNLNFALPVTWVAALRAPIGKPLHGTTATFNWFAIAMALEQKKNWAALSTHASHWTQDEPKNPIAWGVFGEALEHLAQYQRAIDAFRESLRIAPKVAITWYNLGHSYSDTHQYSSAMAAYKMALQIDPGDVSTWNMLGNAYSHTKQYTQAISVYREALRIDPKDADTWNNLGACYSLSHQYNQAILAYREALRIDPKKAKTWFGLGIAYHGQGNRGGAIDAYQTLRTLDSALADELFEIAIAPH